MRETQASIYQWARETFGEAIDRKMAINRARQWKTNGDGTGQHVEGMRG